MRSLTLSFVWQEKVMKGMIGDITASLFMGVMLLALAGGIALMISLETMRLSRGERDFYENGNVLEILEAK
jgi:hypothetical protein